MIFINWILCYALPAIFAVYIASCQKISRSKLIVIHLGLLVSIILLLISGVRLELGINIYFFISFVVAAVLAVYLLAEKAIVYILSSILQEICLLLAAVLLSKQIGIVWGIVLTALVYSLSHLLNKKHWQTQVIITAVWGSCSIALYYFFQQPLLNFTVHILGGTVMISRGILYEKKLN